LDDTDMTISAGDQRDGQVVESSGRSRSRTNDRRSYPGFAGQWARNELWPKPFRESLLLRYLRRRSIATLGPL